MYLQLINLYLLKELSILFAEGEELLAMEDEQAAEDPEAVTEADLEEQDARELGEPQVDLLDGAEDNPRLDQGMEEVLDILVRNKKQRKVNLKRGLMVRVSSSRLLE